MALHLHCRHPAEQHHMRALADVFVKGVSDEVIETLVLGGLAGENLGLPSKYRNITEILS